MWLFWLVVRPLSCVMGPEGDLLLAGGSAEGLLTGILLLLTLSAWCVDTEDYWKGVDVGNSVMVLLCSLCLGSWD